MMMIVNPYRFGLNTEKERIIFILPIFFSTFLIPLISVIMMRMLNMIPSLEMPDKQDRIGPFIASGMLYFWAYLSLENNPMIPEPFLVFMLGATIGLLFAFLINLVEKISLHAVGVGGMFGSTLLFYTYYSYSEFSFMGYTIETYFVLFLVILISGMVGTARLWLRQHIPLQVYMGFVVGIFAQFLALMWLN